MWYLYAFVLLAGIANAVQAGLNSQLSKGLAESLTAGLIVAAGTATCILTVGLLSGHLAWPTADQVARMPWWAWCGGLLGGAIILSQFIVARQIGAAPFLGLLVTAGVVTSVLLDHYGWLGFEQHGATAWRLCGAGLMIAGVTLVALS